jgi:hypothetical protein
MRLRLSVLAFVALLLAAVCGGGCKFSGESAIYMTIDAIGAQHRNVFFVDTESIYCNVLFSTAKQDSTIDFTIKQTASADGGAPMHPVFAGGEQVPGPGTETVVNYLIPPNGLEIQFNCIGQCVQNGVACPAGYFDDGPDTAGVGATCCDNPTGMQASCAGVLPYPAGTYQCEVQIDGVLQTEAPTFLIQYPPPVTGPNGDVYICPVAPPVSGITCVGWVPPGAKCPGYNAPEICVCEGAAWNCGTP